MKRVLVASGDHQPVGLAIATDVRWIDRELETLDAGFGGRYQALQHVNRDLQNLMDNTGIAILLLDSSLCIRTFTPAIADILPLRDSDRGRPLKQVVSTLVDADFLADVCRAQRSLASIEREVRIRRDNEVSTRLMRVRPCRTVDNLIDGVVVTLIDISATVKACSEQERFAALARASGDAIVGFDLDGVLEAWNEGAERLLGFKSEEVIGRSISDLTPPGYEEEQRGISERLRRGEEVAPLDTVRRHKDGSLVHVTLRATPILSDQNIPIGVSETMRDISARVKGEEHNRLLTRELAHRSKNLLALVQVMMIQTAYHSTSLADFAKRYEDRLRAISHAHDLLLARDLKGARVADLVRMSLKPFTAEEAGLEMHGPDMALNADAVHTLSLVLHELATNASKFGALTTPTGKIVVEWGLDSTSNGLGRWRMTWRETGGPIVLPPQNLSFGHEIIAELPKHELKAGVTLSYLPEGLVWGIDIAADRVLGQTIE